MEGSAMRLKRKYVKKAENESKIGMEKKRSVRTKKAVDEEIRDSNPKVSDVKKQTENISKIVTRKKRFLKSIEVAEQMKSDTPTNDEIQSDGSTSSDEDMENYRIKSGRKGRAVKPIKAVDEIKSDGKKEALKPKKAAVEIKYDGKNQAVKPKEAADQMKADAPTDDEVQFDGSSSSDEEIDDKLKFDGSSTDENSDAVISDAMKKTENVKKIEKKLVNPKKEATLTAEGMQRNENSDAVVDHAANSAVVENLSGQNSGENVVAILSRIEGKLNSILRDRRTEKRMYSALVCMPYNLKEDIFSYNKKLIDSKLFLEFVTFLESVGGKSDGKIVCNMLHQIATPNLLSQFEWRETSPFSFQTLKNIIKAIHVAAEKNCSEKYDLTVCGEIIKTSLRNARGLSKG